MSNVAIGYPNRIQELTKLHNCTWVDNPNAPLSKIQTTVLAETARTTDFSTIGDKRVSFGISLNPLQYRTLGVIALLNHNLSSAATVRFSVFNENPITYADTSSPVDIVSSSGTIVFTAPTAISGLTVGDTVKVFGYSSMSDSTAGSYFTGTVSIIDLDMITITKVSNVGTGTYQNWIICADTAEIVNAPNWQFVWKRVYQTTSTKVHWRSKNFWRGCLSPEERESYTKTHITFLKHKTTGEQCWGSHVHIDINDTSETVDVDMFIELGRVFLGQYTQPTINPEYGAIEHNFMDTSEITTSNSGAEFYYEKQKARTVSIQWNYLTEDEAFGDIYNASRSQGMTREVLYVFNPDDTGAYQYARSFIGRFTQLNALTMPNVGLYGASINLKEII